MDGTTECPGCEGYGYHLPECTRPRCVTHHHACACREAAVAKLVEALEDAVSHVAGRRLGYFGDHRAYCDITVRPERLRQWQAALDEFHGRKQG